MAVNMEKHELRKLDTAKEASMDLVALNNTVVNMRSVVKATKVQVIHKLSRMIQKLKNKKGTEAQKEKNLRKAQRMLDEIIVIKGLNADSVTKFALANKTTFGEVCKQPLASPEVRSVLRLAEHRLMSGKVKVFRAQHGDWEELAAYLTTKQTGRRFRTKEQKMRAATRGSRFLDVDTLIAQTAGITTHHKESHVAHSTDTTHDSPEQTEADQKQTKADPKQTEADPKQTEADPKQTKADQKQTKADPKQTEADPKQTEADQKQTKADQKQTKADQKQTEVDKKHTSVNQKQTDVGKKQTKAERKQRNAVKNRQTAETMKNLGKRVRESIRQDSRGTARLQQTNRMADDDDVHSGYSDVGSSDVEERDTDDENDDDEIVEENDGVESGDDSENENVGIQDSGNDDSASVHSNSAAVNRASDGEGDDSGRQESDCDDVSGQHDSDSDDNADGDSDCDEYGCEGEEDNDNHYSNCDDDDEDDDSNSDDGDEDDDSDNDDGDEDDEASTHNKGDSGRHSSSDDGADFREGLRNQSKPWSLLTEVPCTSTLVQDPFFLGNPTSTNTDAPHHWIEEETVKKMGSHWGHNECRPWRGWGQPHPRGGHSQSQPWRQDDDQWLRGDREQRQWDGGRGHRGQRGRGTFSARGGSFSGGRGEGRGHRGEGRGHSSQGYEKGWRKEYSDSASFKDGHPKDSFNSRGQKNNFRGHGRKDNFRGQGHKERSSHQQVWKREERGDSSTKPEDPSSHPSWDAHRKRKMLEKNSTFSGKHIKFDD